LEAFHYSAPFDPSIIVNFRKRLPEAVVEVTVILIDIETLWQQAAYTPQKGEAAVSCCGQEEEASYQQDPQALKYQLSHLKRNLSSIVALIACGGTLLAAGGHIYQKLLVVRELVRQRTILYHAESRSIPDRIVSIL
jgi:hypothetical protein